MSSAADIFAWLFAGMSLATALLAVLFAALRKLPLWFFSMLGLLFSGLALAGLQYDGRGTFLMNLATLALLSVVALISALVALIGWLRRRTNSRELK
ncbi:hypothetical protein AAG596_03280 [Citromicrobium bathyomarinum]|uniref:hypothetical protein n=1 Tax=Citromicrobium bathyomarinum TaxID=72174 RepID=UPI00315ADEC4